MASAKRRKLYPSHHIDAHENPANDGRIFIDSDSDSVPQAVRVSSTRKLIDDLATSSDDDDGQDSRRRIPALPAKVKVEWSDDEDDDPDTAYDRFKKQKRKRESFGPRRKKVDGAAIVGKRAPKSRSSRSGPAPDEIQTDEELEVDGWEPEVPDYLKTRKDDFSSAREKLDHAGLRLPPKYDDLDFSDDERIENLKQKPDLLNTKPSRANKDVSLPYSLGVIPAPIAQWLRDYQVDGTAFLHELFVYQKGGILGDDMGLGKTIQVIAFLTAAFGKTGDERDAKRMRKMRRTAERKWYPRVLLICPGSLIINWKNELDRWGWWHVDVYHGDNPHGKDAALQAAKSGRCEIMITTYTTYRLQKDAINMVEWDCCIADECHTIKGRRSEITKAMNDVNALCRIGLTGTAIQNNYEELWTLLNWSNLGAFGPLASWKQVISEPLKIGQAHDATVPQLAQARKVAKKLVNNLLPEFFLRRMKTLIAHQLPKKSDRVVFCPLTPTQADAYENFADSDIVRTIVTSTEPCDCGLRKKRGWCCHTHVSYNGQDVTWQNVTFPAMATLQKLSNHLASLIPSSSEDARKQEKDLFLLELILPHDWKRLYNSRDNILNYANAEYCGKWKILKKLLRFWHDSGDKVLVFSHSVRLLRMLQTLFNATTSYNVSYLDGQMSLHDRAAAVDAYNADPNQFVFLISTRAGGVGLNITSANKVVIFDPNWNPAYDLQAQDRAYRIGQVRDVEVFRLISAGTIEEIVYARQIYKQQQANIGYNASMERRYFKGVQNAKEKKGEIFGLANLFAFHGENVVLRDIVNKTNVAESKAGVAVVGLDMSQGADGEDDADADDLIPLPGSSGSADDRADRAMSQLAALIADGDDNEDGKEDATPPQPEKAKPARKARTDPVQAILSKAGVSYTHENSEVIGTSKIESRLSRRAEETGAAAERAAEHVFASQELPSARGRDGRGGIADPEWDDDAERGRKRYGPPEEVRRRQFCSMAAAFGYGATRQGVEVFAAEVEGWSQARRRAALERFYELRRRDRGVGVGGHDATTHA
ncbi:hypothetical protein FH972_022586 [Carpinus fangiana]|uniref:Helicase C-terminal domain-containing protein n=1 Tax=Carpinus fangiana TaxID=176857 RepID=A0A5N6KT03_9ROSI|nr:hypothetical protein FH972_022586 [Carpinus fangiana]